MVNAEQSNHCDLMADRVHLVRELSYFRFEYYQEDDLQKDDEAEPD